MKSITCFALVTFISLSGCRTLQPEYSLFKGEQEERTDELWRQGYGYKNPNVDRIRNGQEPLNLNGSPNTFESAAEDVGERAVGNAIAFAIFEGVPAIFRGLSKKLRR
jgi:hypothetical protein